MKSVLLNRFIFQRITNKEIQLFLNIVKRSRTLLTQKYPDAEFHIIFWHKAHKSQSRKILNWLNQEHFDVHVIQDILPNYKENWRIYNIPNDGHPNAMAQKKIAQYVVENIIGIPHNDNLPNPSTHVAAKIP